MLCSFNYAIEFQAFTFKAGFPHLLGKMHLVVTLFPTNHTKKEGRMNYYLKCDLPSTTELPAFDKRNNGNVEMI